MRNIFEIKEMHVTKINESNYVTYFMIDLYQCHLHERYYYSLLFNERSVWYKKKRVYVKQNDLKLGAQWLSDIKLIRKLITITNNTKYN